MSSCEFEINGCEELKDKINQLLKTYPNETNAELEKITNDFKKDVNKKFPHGGASGGSKSVKKKWKKFKMIGQSGLTAGIEMQNQAPVFHLVENGHELYLSKEMYAAYRQGKLGHIAKGGSGKKGSKDAVHVGFVPGKHYCEKTRNEWNNGEFESRCEKHVNKLLKKVDLI